MDLTQLMIAEAIVSAAKSANHKNKINNIETIENIAFERFNTKPASEQIEFPHHIGPCAIRFYHAEDRLPALAVFKGLDTKILHQIELSIEYITILKNIHLATKGGTVPRIAPDYLKISDNIYSIIKQNKMENINPKKDPSNPLIITRGDARLTGITQLWYAISNIEERESTNKLSLNYFGTLLLHLQTKITLKNGELPVELRNNTTTINHALNYLREENIMQRKLREEIDDLEKDTAKILNKEKEYQINYVYITPKQSKT